MKHVIEQGLVDRSFIDAHSEGFEALAESLAALSNEDISSLAGVPWPEIAEFGELIGTAGTCVLVWSMGATQHAYGEDNVRAIVNLGLSRGFVGRPKCGLMPIRGHSGVQGGAEMGAYATVFLGGSSVSHQSAAQLEELWGFQVPSSPGLAAPEMIDAAHRGELDVLFSGGETSSM